MNCSHFIEGPLLPCWIQEQMSLCGREQPDEQMFSQVAAAATGALASFQGIIRADAWQGQTVQAIEYSAYLPLAERLFAQMEQRITRQYWLADLRIWHSLGQVRAGECSMLVLAASGHRAEAFDGLRAAVEAVKAEAPVWKRELFASGQSRWVEGPVSPQFEPEPFRTKENNK